MTPHSFLIWVLEEVLVGTVTGMISAYLYEKLKSKSHTRLKIEGLDIQVDAQNSATRITIKKLESNA